MIQSHRQPPALALWLLRHWGPRYCNESLEGDLLEQYQLNGNRFWYWREVSAAMAVAAGHWVRGSLTRIAAVTFLRLLTEAAALLGAMILTQQYEQICTSRDLWNPAGLLTLAGTVALMLSFGFHLSLCVGRFRRGSHRQQKAPYKSVLAAFVLTALSTGTLTWASTRGDTHCGTQSCLCHSAGISGTAAQPTSATHSLP